MKAGRFANGTVREAVADAEFVAAAAVALGGFGRRRHCCAWPRRQPARSRRPRSSRRSGWPPPRGCPAPQDCSATWRSGRFRRAGRGRGRSAARRDAAGGCAEAVARAPPGARLHGRRRGGGGGCGRAPGGAGAKRGRARARRRRAGWREIGFHLEIAHAERGIGLQQRLQRRLARSVPALSVDGARRGGDRRTQRRRRRRARLRRVRRRLPCLRGPRIWLD